MAVQHGYGKIAGANSLVFAYDTGDTRNSYKGEPTVNTANTTAMATYWNNSGTATWSSDDTLVPRLFSNLPVFSMEKLTTGNSHIGIGSTSATVSTEYNYSVYVWIPSSNSVGMSGSVPYMRPQGANYLAVSLRYQGSASWETWPRDQWIRITGTATTQATNVTSAYISCYLNTAGDKIYLTAPQFEQKSHATPFVNGTRSATEGLKDLTGNSSIDISDANYGSAANLDFDGTGDYLRGNIDPTHLQGDYTIETIIKHQGTSQWEGVWSNNATSVNWDNTVTLAPLLTFNGNSYPSTQYQIGHNAAGASGTGVWLDLTSAHMNRYVHVTLTREGTTIKIYAKWSGTDLYTSGTFSAYSIVPKDNFIVGRHWYNSGGANQTFNGEIPVVKIYNRALTAAEVANNYNHYKGRFNI